MYHLTEAYLMAFYACLLAGYIGALVFGGMAVAPLAVKLLDEGSSAILLRSFWLRYHRFAVAAGLVLTVSWAVGSAFSAVPLVYATALIGLGALMTLSFWVGLQMIPAINAARDRGENKRFMRLHTIDIVLVALGLVASCLLLAGLVYVLPGQFTFWPTDDLGMLV